jgi:ankyrin repeat protein
VSLSIQSICDARSMKVAGDVENAIGKLPSSLRGLYDIIYDQLPTATDDPENTNELTTSLVVRRTINWILCAQAHLSTAAFISALWITDPDEDAIDSLTKDQVLDACCNLVVHDTAADTFRFAHLSVREYLENRSDFDYTYEYGLALSRCFQSFDSPKVDFSKHDWDEEPFTIYARDNLVKHYRRVEIPGNDMLDDQRILPETIKALIKGTLAGCCFEKWMSAIKSEVGREALAEVKRYTMKQRVCSKDPHYIPLFLASYFGLETLIYIFSETSTAKGTSPWETKNLNYQTPLLVAVERRNMRICTAILKCGADIDYYIEAGSTVLTRVIEDGSMEFLTHLLRNATDVPLSKEQKQSRYTHMLQIATMKRKWTIIPYLIELARAYGIEGGWPQTLFMDLVEAGHYSATQALLSDGIVPTVSSEVMLSTALIMASKGILEGLLLDHTRTVNVLLEAGADANSRDSQDSVLLHAVNEGRRETAELLLSKGAGFRSVAISGQGVKLTPCKDTCSLALTSAARRGFTFVVGVLLRKLSTNGNQFKEAYSSSLDLALENSNIEMAALLLNNGAEYVGNLNWLIDLLKVAVLEKKIPIVETLLRYDVLESRPEVDTLALFNMDLKTNSELTNFCLRYPPKSICDSMPLLCGAVSSGSTVIVRLLLELEEIATNLHEFEFETALELAARNGHLDIFMLLLKHGTAETLTSPDDTSWSVLEVAVSQDKLEIVEYLLHHDSVSIT